MQLPGAVMEDDAMAVSLAEAEPVWLAEAVAVSLVEAEADKLLDGVWLAEAEPVPELLALAVADGESGRSRT